MYTAIGNLNNPKAIVQIIHGMHEYGARYSEFSEYLASKNFLVILSDHKGHGEKALKDGTLGVLNEDFSVLVEKQKQITFILKEKYPHTPIFILGHSLGSFVAQAHMKHYSHLCKGYLLLGSRGKRRLETFTGKYVMKLISKLFKNPCDFCNFLLFKKMNYSWLTKDEEVIKKYVSDPLCRFNYTPNFYFYLLDFLDNLYNKKDFYKIDRSLPLFIIAGDKDPIGVYGISVKKLFNFYRSLGFRNIFFKLYHNDRHELLHETDKYEIYNEIDLWLEKTLNN